MAEVKNQANLYRSIVQIPSEESCTLHKLPSVDKKSFLGITLNYVQMMIIPSKQAIS